MVLNEKESKQEEIYLENTSKEISCQLKSLEEEIHFKESEITEFKKVLWESKGSIDSVEMTTDLLASELEANLTLMKMDKYKRLLRTESSPYFGRVDLKRIRKIELNKYILD